MDLFGFQITRKPSVVIPPSTPVTPTVDGSTVLSTTSNMGGFYTYTFDLDGTIKNEIELINRYREISTYPECDKAVEQVCNDAIIVEDEEPPVKIDLSSLEPKYHSLEKKISDEFDTILKLLNFNRNCHDIFKRWYVDGHLYYFAAVDPNHPKKGIQEMTYIDPRKIKRVIEVEKEKKGEVDVVRKKNEFYIFNDSGLANATQGVKLTPLSVVDVKSGLSDANSGNTISYLYKAIKPVNQLKMMEDAMVIYRISRAPERRIFYVDVGNMQPQRAEQYVQSMMNKFRNKVQYDASTGEVKENRNFISMMEDYWLPRREGGRATEITTLPPGQNLSEIEDILYFQKKLYNSLCIPLQRLMPENQFALGRSADITREEIIFAKFIQRLRNNFSDLFREALKIQLLAKNIIKPQDFDDIFSNVYFRYQHDNYFEEIKKIELFNERIGAVGQADAYSGKYFSKHFIVTQILRLTEDEWEEMQEQMIEERDEDKENGMGDFADFDSDGMPDRAEEKGITDDEEDDKPKNPVPPQFQNDDEEEDEPEDDEDEGDSEDEGDDSEEDESDK